MALDPWRATVAMVGDLDRRAVLAGLSGRAESGQSVSACHVPWKGTSASPLLQWVSEVHWLASSSVPIERLGG